MPANDEKKIIKSSTLDCDSIVFDLEDAVPSTEKAVARTTLERLLRELDWKQVTLGVRINKEGQGYSRADIDTVKREEKISFVVSPKSEGSLNALHRSTGKPIMPLIETALGLLRVHDAVTSRGVFAIGYGAADLANSVEGNTKAYLGNLYVKTKIVIAARAYGISPVDNVFFDLSDLNGFRLEAMQSRELGYVGKQVIHPSQIEIANNVYSPSREEIEHAESIVRAYEAQTKNKKGALRLNGELVDAVHYRRALGLLEKTRSH